MDKKQPMTYAASGVDIDAANAAKSRIRELVRSTYNSRVLSEVGLFGGLYHLEDAAGGDTVLVSSADGVGTKLRIAFLTGIHHTVGRDLVAHCVNDILVQGAVPLFFLDYIATGKLEPEVVTMLISGLVAGCRDSGCVLIGGETAEMPDFYQPGEYDLAGFIVGVVRRENILTGEAVRVGDTLLGLPSRGLHTNGYSLARRIVFDRLKLTVGDHVPELGCTVGEELLKPHPCYLPALRDCLDRKLLHGLAHITGGGLLENIPRILPAGCAVELNRSAWEVPPVFRFLAAAGQVEDKEMFRVFNMGVGMVVICAPADVGEALRRMTEAGERPFVLGTVTAGDGKVVIR
ncbi:MAG: phosphoribosylformylglycinamidine cyclo-ligase [Acidobacteria bacterium]|nr:phosphoribosylformylglycinamidine cyclo-ligase [Acidobacteriota bacterium]